MRHNKHRITAHTGDIVDVTAVSDDEVVVQLTTKTGFVRIKRDVDGSGAYLVKLFNTPKVSVASYVTAANAALELLHRRVPTIESGDVRIEDTV